uniref:Uncharacterized protein n=1 Tax=uncultured Planctomycetota bacterium TaxID=120965 RepID=A0A5B8KFD9_9BACT|nr:hypothetical protein fos2004AM_00015 [uncultured Planctomycetota bacterium]
MAKRSKVRATPTSRPRPAPPTARRRLGPLALLLAAAALTIIGAAQLHSVWSKLPGPSLKRLDWDAFWDAQDEIAGRAQEGSILVIISRHFTRALHEPDRLPVLIDDARAGAARLPHTHLGRLQLAALTMLGLERDGTPAAQWWPRLRVYLEGLDNASFPHFMPDLIEAEASILTQLGLRPGPARRAALGQVGSAHGPLLQYFVRQMHAVAAERRRAGDEASADRCQRIVCRLLREWVLAPGPAGLRLLAAELLADTLDEAADPSAASTAVTIARKCRAWRSAYRGSAAAIASPPPALRIVGDPTCAWSVTPSLLSWLALAAWTASAAAAVGLLALLTGVFWIKTGTSPRRGSRQLVAAVLAAVMIVLVGWQATVWAPDLVAADFQRIESDQLGLPRMPFIAALVGWLLAGLAALLGGRNAQPKQPVGRSAAITWLVLSVLLLPLVFAADIFRREYDAGLAYPLNEQLSQIADPNADGLLDELRAWHP